MKEVSFKEINLTAVLPLTKRSIYDPVVLYTDMCVAVEEKSFLGENYDIN